MSNTQQLGEKSAQRIIKSTAIIGGANAVGTLLQIVRVKAFALLLGPAGIGLVGIYSSVMSMAAMLGEIGVGSSGVRQVADAHGNSYRIASTLFTMRLVTIVLGITAALSLAVLSKPVSRSMFGNYDYTLPIALLSLGVLFRIISDSQMAVLNGLRRVSDLARVNVVGSALGTPMAIAIVWLMGTGGVAYATVLPVLATLACSWWFIRQLRLVRLSPSWQQLKTEVLSLLRLGFAFMVIGLLMTGALLVTRIIFLQRLGLETTGLFQAAWGIGVTNIDFILNAMGIDFYPHLTTCIKQDRTMSNRLVNEQTEVALLLGGPLILGMLSFAGPLIHVFFSNKFALATELLRWLLFGSILKILSWPLGYLIMARAWAKTMVFVEILWCSAYVGLIYLGCPYLGVNSAGYAFVAAYLIYGLTTYVINYSFGGFRWSRASMVLTGTLLLAGMTIMALVATAGIAGYLLSGVITLAFGVFSLKKLCNMVDIPAARKIADRLSLIWPAIQPTPGT
jgi:PST family polysaccharide transporter